MDSWALISLDIYPGIMLRHFNKELILQINKIILVTSYVYSCTTHLQILRADTYLNYYNNLLISLGQGWVNYGPRAGSGPLALIDYTFSYVYVLCVLLENPINLSTKQLEYKVYDTSVIIRTFRPFQNLGIIMWASQRKVCPPLV